MMGPAGRPPFKERKRRRWRKLLDTWAEDAWRFVTHEDQELVDQAIRAYCAVRYPEKPGVLPQDDPFTVRYEVLMHAARKPFAAAGMLGGWDAAFDFLWAWDERDKASDREHRAMEDLPDAGA